MSGRRWTLSAESITAASAVVAALIALGVGVWENVQERRHNRLSVFPHLDFAITIRRDVHPDSADHATIRLVNEGVGPAILTGAEIRLRGPDGKERVYPGWSAAAETLRSWGAEVVVFAELGAQTVVGIGSEQLLLRLQVPEEPPEGEPHPFDRLLEHLGLVVRYRSIYGDEYTTVLDPGG